MAETGNKNNFKRNQRGLNIRAVQAPKITTTKDPFFNDDNFETLRLSAVSKPESKIVLRDVEKKLPKTPPKSSLISEVKRPATQKEPLPPVFRTTRKTAQTTPKLSARDIKEQEIKKAVKKAEKVPTYESKKSKKHSSFGGFGWARATLAIACMATAVFAVAYFVNLTSADMSIKVAAMQSGIEATYPSYVPRGYDLSDVTSMSGKVSMHFKNTENNEFEITEESSSWDSEALLNGYIKDTYENNYTVVREQGLTLYMGENWEAWVNGGTLYKLSVVNGSLTKKQMKSIAVSL